MDQQRKSETIQPIADTLAGNMQAISELAAAAIGSPDGRLAALQAIHKLARNAVTLAALAKASA